MLLAPHAYSVLLRGLLLLVLHREEAGDRFLACRTADQTSEGVRLSRKTVEQRLVHALLDQLDGGELSRQHPAKQKLVETGKHQGELAAEQAVADLALHLLDQTRLIREDLAAQRDFLRDGHEVSRRLHELVHETGLVSLFRRPGHQSRVQHAHERTQNDQRESSAEAHLLAGALRAAPAGNDLQRRFRQTEDRHLAARGHDFVASQRQFESAAERAPIDGRDGDDRQSRDALEELLTARRASQCIAIGKRLRDFDLVDVGARDENAGLGRAEDDTANGAIVRERFQHVDAALDVIEHLLRQQIDLALRVVEADSGDAVFQFDGKIAAAQKSIHVYVLRCFCDIAG